jgi:hypothetical protein
MPIEFVCGCGRRLRVADQHAGKLARCPACRGLAQIPAALATGGELGFAEENRRPQLDADDIGIELVEDDAPEAADDYWQLGEPKGDGSAAVTPSPPPASPPDAESSGSRREKRTKQRPARQESGVAGLYMDQARDQIARDEWRATPRHRGGGRGLTLFGVHVSAGIITGAVMVFTGLLGLVVLALCGRRGLIAFNPRVFVAVVIYTAVGAVILTRGLVYGQEN